MGGSPGEFAACRLRPPPTSPSSPLRRRRGGRCRRRRHVDETRVVGLRDPASARRGRASLPRPCRPEPQPPRRAGVRGRREPSSCRRSWSWHSSSRCTFPLAIRDRYPGTSRCSTSRTSRSAVSQRGSPSTRSARTAISASPSPALLQPAPSSPSTISSLPSSSGSAEGTASRDRPLLGVQPRDRVRDRGARPRRRHIRHLQPVAHSSRRSHRSCWRTARSGRRRSCGEKERFRTMFESAPTAIMLLRVDGRDHDRQPVAPTLLGYEGHEAEFRHLPTSSEHVAPDDPPWKANASSRS